MLNNWVSFTGGPNGVPVPSPTLFGLEFTRRAKDGGIPIHEFFHVSYNPNLKFIFLYAVLCLVVMLVLLVKHRLTRMPIGRAWEALREDEIACRAMGLNHVLVKLSAFYARRVDGRDRRGCSSPAIRGLLTRRRSPFLSRR
ncbi:Branched-chain amino acid transport system permease protein LivM (TC 3.A.1.4.1) [Klebsiella pneumoniae IS46]|nr:Branched-chain amino acid transport system permease protein LivM (TC 3.A.1.4.1) [Klebsiella pneumoniae IS46]